MATIQSLLQELCRKGKILLKECKEESEGCPSLECQMKERLLVVVTAENAKKEVFKLWIDRKLAREVTEVFDRLSLCNKYKPSCATPIPIVFQVVRCYRIQKEDRRTRQDGWDWVRVLTDRRLNVKEGTQSTLTWVRLEDKVTVPTCVTWAVFPLGNSTIAWVIVVIVVKNAWNKLYDLWF